jgi:hypothetical protein
MALRLFKRSLAGRACRSVPLLRALLSRASSSRELRRLRAQARRDRAEIRELASARDAVLARERERIARELHDGLQQTLAAVRFALAEAGRLLGRDVHGHAVAALLAGADEQVVATMKSMRGIVAGLQPRELLGGLVPAIEQLVAGFAARTGLRCELDVSAAAGAARPAPQVALCVYRVLQEALTNVDKHADARAVVVEVRAGPAGLLGVCVADDGRGMDRDALARPDAFGLRGARDRAREIGAEFRVDSAPGCGCRVELRLAPEAGLAATSAQGAEGGGAASAPGIAHALQRALDGVGAQAALLSAGGAILAANRAWREFDAGAGGGALPEAEAPADPPASLVPDDATVDRVLGRRARAGAGVQSCGPLHGDRRCLVQAVRLHDETVLVTRSALPA